MEAKMHDAPISPASQTTFGLNELREEAIRALVMALLGLVAFIFWLIAIQPMHWRFEPVPVVFSLGATAAITAFLLPRGIFPATVALLVGIILTVTVALWAFQSGLLAVIYALIPVVGGMLLGWRYSLPLTAGVTGLVLLLASRLPALLHPAVVEVTLLLTIMNQLLSWLLSRPTLRILDWTWTSYLWALEKAEEARRHRMELVRLSRSLEEACQRLEVANAELERARRAAIKARQLKAEFAAAISHELRTPLNLIIGFSETILMAQWAYRRAPLPEVYRDDIEVIYRNACHLSDLIDDVLELSQVEVHRLGLNREPSALAGVVDEAVRAVEMLLRDRGLRLILAVPPDIPVVSIDRTRIRQVLINLLVNAARHTSSGGEVRIDVTVRDEEVVVAIADSGVGIPPEEVDNVFQEFYQVGGTSYLRPGGLGLSISKRFVELHGGSMWVESTPQQGSTFYFTLPVCDNIAALLPEAGDTWARVVALGKPVLLVLADDGEAIRLFQRFLDRYQVVATSSVIQAIRLVAQEPVRALVAVGPTGEAMLAQLREHGKRIPPVPTFVCSLRTRQSIASTMGVADYLVKPITQERLRAAFERVRRPIRRILIVDDEPDMVQLLIRMIHALLRRCRVESALTGAAALKKMRRRCPDVLLLDLVMSEEDGYSVLTEMQSDAALQDVPVVVITARGAEEEAVTTEALVTTRPGGLTVGELMKCLEENLEILTAPAGTSPVRSED